MADKAPTVLSVRLPTDLYERLRTRAFEERTSMNSLIVQAVQAQEDASRVPEILTSTEAADLIGVSRPTLMKWARAGDIASFEVRSHTRFRTADVAAWMHKRATERAAAFEELRRIDEQLEGADRG